MRSSPRQEIPLAMQLVPKVKMTISYGFFFAGIIVSNIFISKNRNVFIEIISTFHSYKLYLVHRKILCTFPMNTHFFNYFITAKHIRVNISRENNSEITDNELRCLKV